MNKLYVTALAIAMASYGVSAQSGNIKLPQSPKAALPSLQSESTHPTGPASNAGGAERAAFYTEDFSGGFPAGWTTVDDLTPVGGDPVNFVWANDPAAVTPASAGQPLILTFLAPGASNGFLYADADRGLASAPANNARVRLTTTSIDCSGQPTVLLTMKSTIGVFDFDADTACKVRVSTDGVNWTNFAPFPCLKTGGLNPPCERFSYNPQDVAINISSVAANQANVVLQFQWTAGWDYYWAIDDVELSPLPDNEIVMDYGYTSQFSDGIEYGRTPANQIQSTINVGAEVVNFGANDQTNVAVNVSLVNSSNTEVGSISSSVGTMMINDTTVTDENLVLPNPTLADVYTANFTVTSDQIGMDDNPNNNAKSRSFAVTDNLYSLDGIDVYPDSILTTSSGGTNSFADNEVNVRFLVMYKVATPTTFYGGEVLLADGSAAGSLISLALYDSVDVASTLSNEITVSEDHVVTQDEINAGKVSLAFLDAFPLPVGNYYLAAKLSKQDANDLVIMDDATVPQPFYASMLYIPVDADAIFLYSNGTAWAIRLSADPTVGVKEVKGLDGVSMYPNPTTGVVHINTAKAETTTVEVRNMLGAVVKTATFNGTVNTLDLSGNAAGVYTVRIGNGTNFAVQLVTIK